MYLFYIFALIPVFLGFILWLSNKRIVLWEWLVISLVGFAVAGSMHFVAQKGMTDDVETRSGQIVLAEKFSEWTEYYEQAIYKTEYDWTTENRTRQVGTGKSLRTESYSVRVQKSREVFDHWEPRIRTHHERFLSTSNIETDYEIDINKYQYFVGKFKNRHDRPGRRFTGEHNSRMISGDPLDYYTVEGNGWIEPVTKKIAFENRIKASPSVFSFVTVSTNVPVFEYPKNDNPFVSDRLLGLAASQINILKFDQFNAVLGPYKKVNVIFVGFKSGDTSLGEYQRAKWLNGKKNDLVLTYGWDEAEKKVLWSKVFGWSESEICKRNLETILLRSQINDAILPALAKEIATGYVIKDWAKFDYLSIEPRVEHFVWFWIILVATEVGLTIYFCFNGANKDSLTIGSMLVNRNRFK